ncbi:MAG: DotA/TraY family protein [Sinimarinibacterium sp.]|jgi:conjugal transfer/type IV secretion protein DotA/TraY
MTPTRSLFAALTLFVTCAASAADQTQAAAPSSATAPTVENFFTVRPQDRSAAFMAEIFGPSAWQAATFSDPTQRIDTIDRGGEGGMLGIVSSVLNVACMFLAVIIITWGGVGAVLQGAYEGASASRRYSALWVPLRSVTAFGMLLPIMGGYSLVQMIMLWMIHLSIGIANSAYDLVLDNFYMGKPSIPIYADNSNENAMNVLLTELCSAGLVNANGQSLIERRAHDISERNSVVDDFDGSRALGTYTLDGLSSDLFSGGNWTLGLEAVWSGKPGSGLGEGVCGSEIVLQTTSDQFSNTPIDQAARDLFAARLDALTKLHAEFAQLAQDIIAGIPNASSDSLPSSYGDGEPEQYVVNDYYARYVAGATRYRDALTAAAAKAAQDLVAATQPKLIDNVPTSAFQDELRSSGWVTLGTLYWNMQALNRTIHEVLNRSGGVQTTRVDFNQLAADGLVNPQVWNDTQGAIFRIEQLQAVDLDFAGNGTAAPGADPTSQPTEASTRRYLVDAGTVGPHGSVQKALDAVSETLDLVNVSQWMIRGLTEDGDFVWSLMSVGEIAWNTGVVGFAAGALTGEDEDGNATGAVAKVARKLGPAGKAITWVSGLLSAIAVPLIMIGFFLAFYLPAVPLILWVINIVGWMIQCVKAVMAMPVWAAAHAIPDGDGIAGNSARQGYLLVIGIVLRPVLLIAGILIGAVMLQVVGWFLRFILPLMFASLDVNSPPGLFAFLATFGIVTGLLVALTLKCFSLSHELADEILEWVGGRNASIGDEQLSTRTQQLMAAGAAAGALGSVQRQIAVQTARGPDAQSPNSTKAARAGEQLSHSTRDAP